MTVKKESRVITARVTKKEIKELIREMDKDDKSRMYCVLKMKVPEGIVGWLIADNFEKLIQMALQINENALANELTLMSKKVPIKGRWPLRTGDILLCQEPWI